MEENIYKTPDAILETEEEAELTNNFYVVGLWKFSFLFLFTSGLYSTYWAYKNWRIQKDRFNLDAWPIARGIFQIFFTHLLFSAINDQLKNKQLSFNWAPNLVATIYVISILASRLMERTTDDSVFSLSLSLIPFAITYLCLLTAQKALNIAEDDPKGRSNSRLTVYNILWATPGIIIIGLLLIGLATVING